VKLKPKAVNKPLHYFIVPERDKPGSAATVSEIGKNKAAPTKFEAEEQPKHI
jgi:hypothetical protein